MGTYTDLRLTVALREDTPDAVLGILRGHAAQDIPSADLPDRPFFKDARWDRVLTCSSYSVLDYPPTLEQHGPFWVLRVQSALKNYTDTIEKFLDWLHPYVAARHGDFVGYMLCELSRDFNDDIDNPQLIYYTDAGFVLQYANVTLKGGDAQ